VQEIDDKERKNFEICLLLGTAFGATIGGVATLVGTPPNAFLAAFLTDNYGIEISFARWMLVGVPVTIIMLPICWLVLTRLVYPISFETSGETQDHLKHLRKALGPASSAEWRIGIVFSCVVIGWMTRPWLTKYLPIEGLSDPGIVMIAAFLLFLIPKTRKNIITLNLGAVLIYIGVYIEKGIALITPGYSPDTLGQLHIYRPSMTEIRTAAMIFSLGFLLFTFMAKIAVEIIFKDLNLEKVRKQS
jgi:di/tricarboxylate transporter